MKISVPFLVSQPHERSAAFIPEGVIDDDIEPTFRIHSHQPHRFVGAILVLEVNGMKRRVPTFGSNRPSNRLPPFGIEVDAMYVVTSTGQCSGCSKSDAMGSAGDQCYLVVHVSFNSVSAQRSQVLRVGRRSRTSDLEPIELIANPDVAAEVSTDLVS
jgi:hypothetical protein